MPSLYKIIVDKSPIAQQIPLAGGILNTYAKIYNNLTRGWVQAAINARFESGTVNKQNKQAGACNEILSHEFWWHQTALLPKSGRSLNKALGADIFSIE